MSKRLLASLTAAQTVMAAASAATVTVDAGSQLQRIDGFGFSQAFGRATEFQNAEAGMQQAALDYLFNTTTGAGFSIIRNRIGSGGSGDSIEPTSPGAPDAEPSYVWDEDDSGQVWFSQQAVSYGVGTVYADAWSAPGFMKTSGDEATAGYLCGTPDHDCDSGDWTQAYADFLVQYVKYYAEAGVTVTHLGFLNEPDYSPSYSQMQISSDAKEAIAFIPMLSSTVQAANLSTAIACCDPIGWTTAESYMPYLADAGMEDYLGVITSHTYSADAETPLDTSLRTWVSEAGVNSGAFVETWYASGAIEEGMTWANKIAQGLIEADLSAYLYWEGFEDGQTQSGSHLVDTFDGATATPNGILWAFAMWSRHIRPGAHRLETEGSVDGVRTGAFVNEDGSYVAVLTNSEDAAQSATLAFSGFTPDAASAWVTDNDNTFASTEASVSDGSVTVDVPGHGVVTVKLTGS